MGCLRDQLNVPSGEKHELCRGLHAEQNAIIQAAYHGVGISGATIYTATFPCVICAKMIINAGIVRVVYREAYDDRSREISCARRELPSSSLPWTKEPQLGCRGDSPCPAATITGIRTYYSSS